jgi:alkanesulfonate monooxygenase SsuD/methylene tetrahydromethanopterin reductase-like flavin-dependent oxidoreductase (luciferase family)
MRLSINMTNAAFPGPLARGLGDVARAADQGGLDTLWVGDHLIQAEPGLDLEEPAVEAYTTLGFLAATTSRLRLGTMVSAVTFRPPCWSRR